MPCVAGPNCMKAPVTMRVPADDEDSGRKAWLGCHDDAADHRAERFAGEEHLVHLKRHLDETPVECAHRGEIALEKKSRQPHVLDDGLVKWIARRGREERM